MVYADFAKEPSNRVLIHDKGIVLRLKAVSDGEMKSCTYDEELNNFNQFSAEFNEIMVLATNYQIGYVEFDIDAKIGRMFEIF
jgi:hypothetical protein